MPVARVNGEKGGVEGSISCPNSGCLLRPTMSSLRPASVSSFYATRLDWPMLQEEPPRKGLNQGINERGGDLTSLFLPTSKIGLTILRVDHRQNCDLN